MQPGFQQEPLAVIIGVQAAGYGMLFKNQDGAAETGVTDTGGQAGKAGADNNKRIVSHRLFNAFLSS